MVYQDKHVVALFVFATGSFPTPRCAAEKQDFRFGLFSIEDFSLPIDCMPIIYHNPKIVPLVLRVSTLMTLM